ncbi:MAG: hypothetical protein KY454_05135 [Actinobacteria bacterium]|nr:hypothetical protein [Actinomycetota bacterium]MBW3650588.1 hypothetical protein [Actinomycetota bacterium]
MSLKSWALRRAMGRLRITDDIVRYLTTFQRLGETVEVELPSELLPVGARTVFRAVRTRAAAQLGVDWVWPHWLERQLDPTSAAFVPRGHLPVLTNVTLRNWTAVGTVGSTAKGIVDPRGLLTPWYDGWSLDWWIGAEDRWHFPSREVAVRQSPVEDTPVVETVMRVPGGDAVQRVYAIAGEETLAVVEIVNRSRTPFAVALAVRPYNPEGLAVVERIALHGRTVTVDGRPALFLPKAPPATAASTFHDGDCAGAVTSARTTEHFPDGLRCDAGLAQAAFVFPLAHSATLRVAVPLGAERRSRRRRLSRRRARRALNVPHPLPPSETVVRGWQAQTEHRGMRLVLPPGRLASAVEANRRYLLLFHEGGDVVPGPFTYHRFWFRDAAYLLAALDRYGFHREAAEVIRHFPARQRVDGFFFSQRQEWDANGSAIWSMAEHWRLTGDLSCIDVDSVARGARWIERKRHAKRRRKDPALRGLMPASISAEHLGPFDYFYWDDFWSLRGLRDAAVLLGAAGQAKLASEVASWAASLEADLGASMAMVAERTGSLVIPAGPRRRVDTGIIGSLVACSPLQLLPPHHPGMAATVEAVRQRFCVGPAFYQGISHTGQGTYLTLQLAAVELAAGDRRCLERLQWLVELATPTFTWPEAIHPTLGGGCMGDGHHGWAAADFLSLVRNLLVTEVEGGLVLAAMLPGEWRGQAVEVHDAPTHFGTLSFAIRWHGDRPALLWELDRRSGSDPVTLRAPGLDPQWSTTEDRGETLLSASLSVS